MSATENVYLPMKKKHLLAILFLLCFATIAVAQTDETNNQARIDITAAKNKIRWDEDIIRSWEAIGDVSVEYARGEKSFVCTAESVFFNRSGDSKPFTDKLTIKGNIHANLNGMEIESEHLVLTSDVDSYKIDSATETTIQSDSCTVITELLHFDASNGIGNFPAGAEFIFMLDNDKADSQKSSDTKPTENMFGQCLRIDTTGGRLVTPAMELHYTLDDNGKFKASNVVMPSGGELFPLEIDDLYESKFVFGSVEFNIQESRLVASKQIQLINGPCAISANNVELDWENHHLEMSDDVILTRDMIEFTTGAIEITWDDEGRISLTATDNPSMCIKVPESATDEILNM